MNLFTLLASLLTMLCHYMADLYTADVLHHVLLGAPATVLGMICGLPIARRINQEAFRRILRFLIFSAGCVCLARGCTGIF